MSTIRSIIIIMTLILTAAPALYSNSIKISITSQSYNFDSPWQADDPNQYTVSGCVIESNMILTTSYALADHVLIEVSRPGGTRKYKAHVIVKDYNSGLALLGVNDTSFFDGISPLTLMKSQSIIGKKGIIRKWDSLGSSREYTTETINSSMRIYKPNCAVLMHSMSTTINENVNGSPVLIDDKLAGISAGFDNSTKTLYVISSETIQRMLVDLKNGNYDGVPFFWIEYSSLSSDVNLRQYLGLKETETGVYVAGICKSSSGADVLKEGDVILSIDGTAIDDNGMYNSQYHGRLNFYGLVYLDKIVGDTVKIKIVRNKKRMTVTMKLKPLHKESFVIQQVQYDDRPDYLIYGGLIFQDLSSGFIETWGKEWYKKANNRMLYFFNNHIMDADINGQRIIVLNRVLPAGCNDGYHYNKNLILLSVNSKKVKNISHLDQLLIEIKDEFVKFDFVGGESIILRKDEVLNCQDDITSKYNISRIKYFK